MSEGKLNVIPIRRQSCSVVELAYQLWLDKGFRGGSPEAHLLAAQQEVDSRSAKGPALVSKHERGACRVAAIDRRALVGLP